MIASCHLLNAPSFVLIASMSLMIDWSDQYQLYKEARLCQRIPKCSASRRSDELLGCRYREFRVDDSNKQMLSSSIR
jgi:hypothetical protein